MKEYPILHLVLRMCKSSIDSWNCTRTEPIYSALTTIPFIFIVVAGLARMWILSKRERLSSDMTKNWLYFAKMVCLLKLKVLHLNSYWDLDYSVYLIFYLSGKFWLFCTGFRLQVDRWCSDFVSRPFYSYFGRHCLFAAISVILLLTLYQVFVIGLHHLEYTRNRISSAVLLFFWLFIIIVDGFKLRTQILDDKYYTNSTQFVLFAIAFALSVTMFVLENIPRPKSQYIMLEEDEVKFCLLRVRETEETNFLYCSMNLLKRKWTFLDDSLLNGWRHWCDWVTKSL